MQAEEGGYSPAELQNLIEQAIASLDFAKQNANGLSARSLALVITKLEEAKLWLQQFRVQSGELTIHYTSNDTAEGQQDTEAAG